MDRSIGEQFAEALIKQIRDPAIKTMSAVLSGQVKAPFSVSDVDGVALVCASVDETIFRLLDAIDNCVIELQWVERTPSGNVVGSRELAGSSDFDLAGYYVCEGGWRHVYSQQPVFPI